MHKPIIAVSTSFIKDNNLEKSTGDTEIFYIDKRTIEIIRKFNATPLLLSSENEVNSYSEIIDGIILPGSDLDSDKKFYDENLSLLNIKKTDLNRDELDKELIKLSMEKRIPLLGICRGIQTMNISLSGTLKKLPKSNFHTQRKGARHSLTHSVVLKDNSIIKSIYKSQKTRINSCHGTQISKLAKKADSHHDS